MSAKSAATIDVRVPEVAEGVTEGTVVSVLVAAGDEVTAQQELIELETDKAVVAVPCPVAGSVHAVKVAEGDVLAVGDVILELATADAPDAAPEPDTTAAPKPEPAPVPEAIATPAATAAAPPQHADVDAASPPAGEGDPPPASPTVRRLARELGADLRAVRGSGPRGRISHDDVRDYVRLVLQGQTRGPAEPEAAPLPDFKRWGGVRREPMSRVREVTAAAMSRAWREIPMVTHHDRAELDNLERFRKEYNAGLEPGAVKLTLTAILVKICAEALRRHPKFNSSVDLAAKELVYKDYVHVGVAVDTERGLLVPVIRDADRKGIPALKDELDALAGKARSRRIDPADLEGGCFTISNLGGIGGHGFDPIVYPPQVAILGVSRGAREPVWNGAEFEPRMRVPLSLSYDHRVIDGAEAARFLRWICEVLEEPVLLAF